MLKGNALMHKKMPAKFYPGIYFNSKAILGVGWFFWCFFFQETFPINSSTNFNSSDIISLKIFSNKN